MMKILSIVAALALFLFCFEVSATGKIDVNTASLNDLIKIIHIGEKRGLELISLRPFSSLDDLARIKGIGSARIEDIKKQGLAYVETSPERAVELPEVAKLTTEAGTKDETAPLGTVPEAFSGAKIDINTASAQELQMLVGIGAVLSQRIIDIRPFRALDELTKVHGIGAGTLENIRNQGLAWIDPSLTPPKTEEIELFDKGAAASSVVLQQVRGEEIPRPLFLFLTSLVLSLFSGAMILALKRKLKTFS
jgi:competence ComEA-like helix-hairpin-helix protein